MGSNNRGDSQVLSFHVASEEFSCIELPRYGGGGDVHGEPFQRSVLALRDSLALVDSFHGEGFVSIWVMEEHGLAESWTRRHVINVSTSYVHVSIQKNRELWFFRTLDGMISYDVETKQMKILDIDFLDDRFVFTENYLESLVLFKGVSGQVRRLFMSLGKENRMNKRTLQHVLYGCVHDIHVFGMGGHELNVKKVE
ncbi:hypothetical protein Ancab_021600 [Ancistrocladus abbreviatus]